MEQIASAHHVADALPCIVHHDAKVIAGCHIAAGQNDIAPQARVALDAPCFTQRASPFFDPFDGFVDVRPGLGHIQPQGIIIAPVDPFLPFPGIKFTVIFRVVRHAVRIAWPIAATLFDGFDFPATGGPAHECRIDQAQAFQPAKCLAVARKVFGLAAWTAAPLNAEPVQIVQHLLFIFLPASLVVDIFKPQQQPATGLLCLIKIKQSRIGVAKVQRPVGARSKSENRHIEQLRLTPICRTELSMDKITSLYDVNAGLAILLESDQRLVAIARLAGPLPLRLRAPGFAGLAEIVIAQQVSKASAAAMTAGLAGLIDPLTSANLLAAGEAPLISAGLSRAKQSTLTLIARAIEQGNLDLEQLCQIPADEAERQLVAIKGIGPWTAEVFLLFCAGHQDIFPAGDVALQHAVGKGLNLDQRPSDAEVKKLAQNWAPWRGVAARLFWAYYAHLKQIRTAMPL